MIKYPSLFLIALFMLTINVKASDKIIRIDTQDLDLILRVSPSQKLYQAYLGAKLIDSSINNIANDETITSKKWEVYPASGGDDYFEPAIALQHNDMNMTSIFYYKSHVQESIDDNIQHTIITLADNKYPVTIKLHYLAYFKENIVKSWSEITHQEKKPLIMSSYFSNMLYFDNETYHLDEYSGDWAREVQYSTQQLQFGKKIIDTKLGSRAAMYAYPFFRLGIDKPVQEDSGEMLLGTIGWTGNFRFTFEVDNMNHLRIISGINPYASTFYLAKNEVFKTPEFIFTYSNEGAGKASRNMHDWARRYQIKDGMGNRLTLLNNWESTYFDFDENKLSQLMAEAKKLGVDMFLLDDGWFGNKYPRIDDRAGLGDWEVMHSKLPNGIPGLVKAAKEANIKFGIWIEPEMVNPKSELFEKHPDWAILLPNRDPYYFRNQLVLDLSNPKVQDYVFGVIENILKENPTINYFKWDCNSPITNIYSPYLGDKQSHLYIEYVRGLYTVLDRVQQKYPNVMMMMCSGGGGRCDYEGLKYFTEFWCSDNTDPIDRIYIQWNFSQVFPVKAMAAHVTSWNPNASIKFRVDVAMMCKLGFDINVHELSADDQELCITAIKNFNNNKHVILDGDQYRLHSPYNNQHASLMYTSKDKNEAVFFSYDLYPLFGTPTPKVKLKGLDPSKSYLIEEINLNSNSKSNLAENGKILSGDYLIKIGLNAFTSKRMNSRALKLTAQ